MKKLILSLLFVCVGVNAHAGFRVGGLLGYRSDTLTGGDTGVGYDSDTSVQVGGLLIYSLFDTVSLRTGFVLADKQYRISTPVTGVGDVKTKLKLSYVDIPVLLQLNIPASSFYFFGGLKFGFLQSATCTTTEPAGYSCGTKVSQNNTMLDLGVGYDLIDLSLVKLGVEFEYERGLTNINTTPGSNVDVKTSGMALNAVGTIGF